MCQSKSEGGRRCDQASSAARSRASLLKRKRRLVAEGASSRQVGSIDAFIDSLREAQEVYGADKVSHREIVLPPRVQRVVDSLHAAGMRPLLVGGAVRDLLIDGSEPKDFDFEVYGADSLSTIKAGLPEGINSDEVGSAFGVLKVFMGRGMEPVDLILPRRDSLVGSGHRGIAVEVDSSMSLDEASARRDFTLNALYHDPMRQVVIDPHGGRGDLENRVLRHINEQFAEDPLRVLRGVQFAARFHARLHPDTARLCRDISDTFATISHERIEGEWSKFFTKKNASIEHGLQALHDTGWDKHFGLESIDRAQAAKHATSAISSAQRAGVDPAVMGIASLMLDSGNENLPALTLTGRDARRAAKALASTQAEPGLTSRREVKAFARALGPKGVSVAAWGALWGAHHDDPAYIASVEAAARRHGCLYEPTPDLVTGALVTSLTDRKPGPWIGTLLREGKRVQDEEAFVDEEGARQWVRQRLGDEASQDSVG